MHIGRHTHRAAALAAVTAMLLLGLTWATPADATARVAASPDGASASAVAMPDPVSAENDFIARINQLRTSRGLGALTVDPELTDQARQWAATMAAQGRIFHSSDLSTGITADWQKLGENVGVGGDTSTLFQAFVDSPTHLENLVDPIYTRVGVGVVLSGNRMFTAHRFMGLAPPPPPPTTAPPTTAAPTTVPPTTAPPTTVAPTTAPPTTANVPVAHKLGPVDRLADLVATPDPQGESDPRGDQRASTTS